MRIVLIIIFITLIGALLRFPNLSPYKVYPDTYQNLLVAQNLVKYNSVVGFLGEGGMNYPPFFGWSRPVYPLLMNFFHLFLPDLAKAAMTASFIFGVLTIPLAFFLIKTIFNSAKLGILASVLLATSFNHTVWSGFIETEATSIFFMMLFLLSFFISLKKESRLASLYDLITGGLLTLAVFSRYEYIVVLFPLLLMLVQTKQFHWIKIINILASFILTATIFIVLLYPVPETFLVILTQNNKMIFLSFSALIISFLLILTKNYILQFAKLIVIPLWIISFLVLLQTLFPNIFSPFYIELQFIRNFFKNDLLLTVTSLLGFTLLFKKSVYQPIAIFSIFSIFVLCVLYFNVNSTIERYITHTLPFLLIAASFGLEAMLSFKKVLSIKTILTLGLIVLIPIQLFLTFNGIRYRYNGEWFRLSYFEKAALIFYYCFDLPIFKSEPKI